MGSPAQRSKLYSIGAISLAVGLALFLLLAPAVEREAYLSQIRDGDKSKIESAVRHLCWIEPGQLGLNATLPTIERAHRLDVLDEADAQGCLDKLSVDMQAEYWIWRGDLPGARQSAANLGEAAVDAAMEALEGPDEGLRSHAAEVLFSLEEHLTDEQRAALLESIRTLPEDQRLARLHAPRVPSSETRDREHTVDEARESVERAVTDATSEEESAAGAESEEGEEGDRIDPLSVELERPALKAPAGSVLFVGDKDAAKPEKQGDVQLAPPPKRPVDLEQADGGTP